MSKWTYILSDHACECGCGKLTYLAPFTWAAQGMVKGRPLRFVKGHYRRDLIVRPPLSDRFALYFESGEVDACWPWKGGLDPYGYGYLKFNGKTLKAHRIAYGLHVGPIPEGLDVLHRCDNPPCVNYLSHLFLGTRAENNADKDAKGRGNQGERNPMAQITQATADEMRYLLKNGESVSLVADSYCKSYGLVYGIATGHTWKESQ